MKKYSILLLILSCLLHLAHTQRDNTWVLGYGYPDASMLYGGMKVTFNTGSPAFNFITDTTHFNACNASISDTAGNLLFYTNGIDIRDKNNTILQNGDSLNYGDLWETWHDTGMPLQQGALILPFPAHNNEYFVIHNTLNEYVQGNYYPTEVLYSQIDMSLNQGFGGVIIKNQPFSIQDKAEVAITACRHGNGRDWWLLFPTRNTNCYKRFLLTPNGFEDKGQTCIDGIIFDAVWQAKYSGDGTKYARFQDSTLHIMDFDRCNGLYSNLITIPIPYNADSTSCGGLEFSTDSHYLYLSSCAYMLQYDTWANNIASSRITIGVVDGVPDPYQPGSIAYCTAAPDGKIYILGGAKSLDVINAPDSAGTGCNFVLRGLPLPRLNITIPNFPNFRLGAAFGSGCDSLTVSHQVAVSSAQSKVYPNPAHNTLYIELTKQAQAATFLLYDMAGKEVLVHHFSAKNTQLKLGILPKGVYFYKLLFNNQQEYGKLLIE